MRTKLTTMMLLLSAMVLMAKPHTPAVGTPERKAICDAMREYVQSEFKKPLATAFLFKVEFLRVDGDYAGFEGFPVKPDGSPLPDGALGDQVFTTFLKKKDGVWQVVRDLSRSDVPTAEEISEIRKNFPADFPSALMPEYWRNLLRPSPAKRN